MYFQRVKHVDNLNMSITSSCDAIICYWSPISEEEGSDTLSYISFLLAINLQRFLDT